MGSSDLHSLGEVFSSLRQSSVSSASRSTPPPLPSFNRSALASTCFLVVLVVVAVTQGLVVVAVILGSVVVVLVVVVLVMVARPE